MTTPSYLCRIVGVVQEGARGSLDWNFGPSQKKWEGISRRSGLELEKSYRLFIGVNLIVPSRSARIPQIAHAY